MEVDDRAACPAMMYLTITVEGLFPYNSRYNKHSSLFVHFFFKLVTKIDSIATGAVSIADIVILGYCNSIFKINFLIFNYQVPSGRG